MLESIRRITGKIALHAAFRIYKKEDVPDIPVDIQLEPTVRCNLRCVTCTRDKVIGTYKKTDLDPDEVGRIISFFPRLRSVKLQGLGEPFLHPRLEEVLKKFKEKNTRVWSISNGTLFGSERYRRLALDYMSDIAVSIDSVDAKLFAELRKGGDLNKIIEGTRQLVRERDSDKRYDGVVIGMQFVVSHKNYRELEKLYGLASYLKLDYVCVADAENWLVPGEEHFEESAAFIAASRECTPKIKKAARRLFVKFLKKGIMLVYKDPARRIGHCHWPFKSMFITVEGLVTPCCIRMHRADALGNILKASSLMEIWGNKGYRDLRKSHMEGDVSNVMCGRCPD